MDYYQGWNEHRWGRAESRQPIDWELITRVLFTTFLLLAYIYIAIIATLIRRETLAQRREIDTYERCNAGMTTALRVKAGGSVKATDAIHVSPGPTRQD